MEGNNLAPIKNNFFTRLREIVRSRLDKNYTLNSNSPRSLFNNKKLVMRTLKVNSTFLESLPDEIIFQNDDAIREAIENGYFISLDSRFRSNKDFILKYMDIGGKMPNLYALDEELVADQQVQQKILEQAKNEHMVVDINLPAQFDFLKQDRDLALIYYNNLLSNENSGLNPHRPFEGNSILNKKLIEDTSFISDYINLCRINGINNQTILDSILNTPGISETLRGDISKIDLVFNELKPVDLRAFFDKLQISDEELEDFFKNDFTGNLKELGLVCERNPLAIDLMNGKLLGKGIPTVKLQEYAGDKEFQEKLLGLSAFKYKLFEKISDRNLSKTKRWNRLDSFALDNLSDGYYEALLDDLLKETQMENKITGDELDVLTNLFSASIGGYGPEKSAEYGYVTQTNNVFNIKKKGELGYYDKIRETVCNIAITNPQLQDSDEVIKFGKYLQYFKTLEPIDRVKLAIIEKTFGMSLEDASIIMQNFGKNINSFDSIDEMNKDVVEQVKAVCNILNCDDIEGLQEVGQLTSFVSLDLDQGQLLFDDAKEVFEKDLKKDLYSPREEDLIGTQDGIKIYKAPLEFEAITKFSGFEPDRRQWEKSESGANGQKNFRRKTCMSFTNGELINPQKGQGVITFGFGKAMNDFYFGGMYRRDFSSNMSSDKVYRRENEERSNYRGKDDFVAETFGPYNEVIVDTLALDESTNTYKKLMPEYMIYYQENSNMTAEEIANDDDWQKAIEAAKEFGVPIVVVDCEEIRKNELTKIRKGLEQDNGDYRSVKKLVGQIEHYAFRYRDEKTGEIPEILELITGEEFVKKKQFLEENRPQNSFDFSKYTKTNVRQTIAENTAELEGAGIVER